MTIDRPALQYIKENLPKYDDNHINAFIEDSIKEYTDFDRATYITRFIQEDIGGITVPETKGASLLSLSDLSLIKPEYRPYTFDWWLIDRDPDDRQAVWEVGYNGREHCGYTWLSASNMYVRPVLYLESSGYSDDFFCFGGVLFNKIKPGLAFALGDIGEHCFSSDIDNNDYNQSDVKKEIDAWYQANLEYGGK